MDIKIDDLLAFCSYYSLAQTNARLPYFCPPAAVPVPSPKPQGQKAPRKKF